MCGTSCATPRRIGARKSRAHREEERQDIGPRFKLRRRPT